MDVVEGERAFCACYTEHQEFHKLLEHKATGLVIYSHTTRTEKDVIQGEVVESAGNTSHDVFILHNTKDETITPDLMPALEKNYISCPRCRKIFEHAQELLQKVTSIDRKNVMGVCDHCRKKAESIKKPCNECEEIVKKFILTRGEQKEYTKKYIKIWLSKFRHPLKSAIKPKTPKKEKIRAYSDLQINRLCQTQHSPKSRREPEVKQLFYPEIHKSDTNLREGHTLEKSVVFAQPIESVEKTYAVPPMLVESNATFVEPYNNVIDAIEKIRDPSLRHTMKPGKESGISYSVSHRPEIYEIPKIAPWEQQETREKQEYYDESEMDVAKKKSKIFYIPENLDESVKYVKRPSKRKFDLKLTQDLLSSETEIPKKRIMKTKIRSKTLIETGDKAKHILHRQFSYYFPIKKEVQLLKVAASSSQIIQSTIEKLNQQAEEEKRKHDEERMKSLEDEMKKEDQEEKKRQAQEKKQQTEEKTQAEESQRAAEEKKKAAEEKKAAAEEQKKYADEQKTLIRENERKRREEENEQIKPRIDKKNDLISEFEIKGKKTKESEAAQKGLKHKTEPKDKYDKITENAKKDLKSKPEPIKQLDEVSGKPKKDLKSKPDPIKQLDEISEKLKKDVKSKSKPIKQLDEVPQKAKKDLKSKSEPIKQLYEVSEKAKKYIKVKPETTKKIDEVTEKSKKDSKLELKEKFDKEAKQQKKAITEVKKTVKEPGIAQKAKENQDLMKKHELFKKKLDSIKEQETLAKKTEKSFKQKAESAKMQQKPEAIAEPLPKKPQSSKEGTENTKEVEQSTKKKSGSIMEKERPAKGKPLTEKSYDDEPKGSSKKDEASAIAEFTKLQADLKKNAENDLKMKKQEEAMAQKVKDLAAKKGIEIKAGAAMKNLNTELQKQKEKERPAKDKPVTEKSYEDEPKGASKKDEASAIAEFTKLQAELKRNAENDLKMKKQEEAEAQKVKDLVAKKAVEIKAIAAMKNLNTELQKQKEKDLKMKIQKAAEEQKARDLEAKKTKQVKIESKKDLRISKIDVCNKSSDDLILRLVQIKQSAPGKRLKPKLCDIDPKFIEAHKGHTSKSALCPLCLDSELEFDAVCYENKRIRTTEMTEIIIGEKIYKYKPQLEKMKEQEVIPLLFQSVFQQESTHTPSDEIVKNILQTTEEVNISKLAYVPSKDAKGVSTIFPLYLKKRYYSVVSCPC